MPRLTATPAEIDKYRRLLGQTPARIAACASGVDAARLSQPPGARGWSAVDILAHLRACSDLWSHSIYAMLTDSAPALPLLDERRWARTLGYAGLDFRRSLKAFTLEREDLLRVLRELGPEAWGRTAVIEGRVHSVFSQARRLALHEAEHCAQIEALLAASG